MIRDAVEVCELRRLGICSILHNRTGPNKYAKRTALPKRARAR